MCVDSVSSVLACSMSPAQGGRTAGGRPVLCRCTPCCAGLLDTEGSKRLRFAGGPTFA
jgi:hypothetical protein